MSDLDTARLIALSEWIDGSSENQQRAAEARTWGRLAKVSEECGEVIAAFIGVTGQNPRKGYTHSMEDVKSELLDVALTALMAYEHVTDHQGESLKAFTAHLQRSCIRVGVETLA